MTFYCRRPRGACILAGAESTRAKRVTMDVLRAVIARLSVDIHHVIEAAGIVVLGLVVYSYARRWFDSKRHVAPLLRAMALGLIFSVIGIGGFTRLFVDVVNAQAAEAARRDAAELRAVTLLARAAAHEINNALMVVSGGLAILARRLPAQSEDAQWAERAREGANKVKDIVTRMNTITQIEEVPGRGLLAPMLDIRRSSGAP